MAMLDFSKLITAQEKAENKTREIHALFKAEVQAHIDRVAQQRSYRDGFALAGYATSSVSQWANEAAIFVTWRDQVWMQAFTTINDNQKMIEPAAFISLLSQPQWTD